MTERMSDIFETQLRTYRKLYTVDSRSLVHYSSLLFRIVNGLSANAIVSTSTAKAAIVVAIVVVVAVVVEVVEVGGLCSSSNG